MRLDGAIQQRMERIFVEAAPFVFRNLHREIVGIRSGAADHGQNFPGARIERHHCAGALAERLLGDLLQIVIDGERDLFAGNGLLRGEAADFFAHAVDDHAPHAVRAHQRIVVLLFEAGFSREVARTQLAIAIFDLLFTDFADVPAGMAHKAVRQIAAAVYHEHFQQRNVGAVGLDERDIGLGGFGLDDNGLKFRQISRIRQLVAQIADGNAQAVGNGGKILFDQRGIVAKQQNAEARIVVDQHAAIAIQHAASRRDDGNGANAVAFGHHAVAIGIDDLQLPEAQEQHADHADDDVGNYCQPRLRQPIVVAKPDGHKNSARLLLFRALASKRRCELPMKNSVRTMFAKGPGMRRPAWAAARSHVFLTVTPRYGRRKASRRTGSKWSPSWISGCCPMSPPAATTCVRHGLSIEPWKARNLLYASLAGYRRKPFSELWKPAQCI